MGSYWSLETYKDGRYGNELSESQLPILRIWNKKNELTTRITLKFLAPFNVYCNAPCLFLTVLKFLLIHCVQSFICV
ncbi:hypothetical protein XELAEV_18004081mg [Xenopus laevis]|uniref:Uncharacterized protein n=1 Tax=Xenopus laevis TaxID=8355 RepID=A0A974GYQ0_XENLA|nr:hypothetical protein XELAEV_18004081mg [Xenopus laevis]